MASRVFSFLRTLFMNGRQPRFVVSHLSAMERNADSSAPLRFAQNDSGEGGAPRTARFEHLNWRVRLVNYEPGQAYSQVGWKSQDKAMYDEARQRAIEAAFADLVSQYSGTLYRVAYSVLRNAADAEDAVQEAFMRVLRHRETLDEVRDQRVWLIRIVWNIVLDRKRRAKTRPETDDVAELARVLPAGGLSAEERAAAAQHHARVLACVEQCPPRSARC